jgi:hypothetical protein
MRRLIYISYRNENNVPECHDKKDGLISLYLDGIRHINYFENLHYRIPREKLKKLKGIDGMNVYSQYIQNALKRDLERHLDAKDFQASFSSEKKTYTMTQMQLRQIIN